LQCLGVNAQDALGDEKELGKINLLAHVAGIKIP